MYWNNLGSEICSIYQTIFENNDLNQKQKIEQIDKKFHFFVNKIKKQNIKDIKEFDSIKQENYKNIPMKTTIKSIKKQLIRNLNKSFFDREYVIFPISDYSLGINTLKDFNIKFIFLFKQENDKDIFMLGNLLGLFGFEFYNEEQNVFYFRKNVKKFCIKIFVSVSQDFELNPYYNIHKSFSDKINIKKEISYIRQNLKKSSENNRIYFDILMYNYLFKKINFYNLFTQQNYLLF